MRAFYFQLYILSKKKEKRKGKKRKRVMLPQPCCRPMRGLQRKAARAYKSTCSYTDTGMSVSYNSKRGLNEVICFCLFVVLEPQVLVTLKTEILYLT